MTTEQVLAFEQLRWLHAGHKEQAIRDRFGVSAVQYYQRLNNVLDDPDADRIDPVTVRRLRRLRDGAARTRRVR